MALRARDILAVSSLFSAPVSRLLAGPAAERARAARRRARLVMDFEPGGLAFPRSGRDGGVMRTAFTGG
jgi:hypothetical protein